MEARKEISRKKRESGKYREWQRSEKGKESIKKSTIKRQNKNHKITTKQWKDCKEYFNNECAYCGLTLEDHKELIGTDFHKEHVDHNGANDLSNCIPSCKLCNSSKWEYTLDDWYNFENIVFHPDRYFKIIKWLEEDYKLFLT